MKILLVSTQDYIHHPVPSRHHYIFEELANRHEIHVPHFHVSRGKERKTNLIVHEATQFPIQNPIIHYSLNAPRHFKILSEIIKNEKIDVVVAAHVLAGSAVIKAAKKHNIPVLFDLKDWFPDSAAAYYDNPIIKWIIREGVWGITKYNLNRSDKITTVSPSLVKKLQKYGFNADLITNGVNTDFFKAMDVTKQKMELGISSDTFIIGFAGTIERWYAIDQLIEILPQIMNFHINTHLLIVGGSLFTDFFAKLQEKAEQVHLQDHISFTGPVQYQDLPRYINMMDVCTIPLSPPQWAEIALPNKFFEYSACGKPILSRPIPDIIALGGENVFIYKNEGEFIEIVRGLINKPRIFSIDVHEYSWQTKAEEMEELLFNLIS